MLFKHFDNSSGNCTKHIEKTTSTDQEERTGSVTSTLFSNAENYILQEELLRSEPQ